MSARRTITGTVTKHEYANLRRGAQSTQFTRMLLDAMRPLPNYVLWSISTDEPNPVRPSARPRFYRTRSGRLPKPLEGRAPGERVTFMATVEDWSNGLGGYITRVKVLEPAEQTAWLSQSHETPKGTQ